MKKRTATILFSLIFTAFAFAGTAVLREVKNPEIQALAETNSTLNAELISPASYAEYLPIKAPSSVSVNQNHTAITDGDFLYLYDNAQKSYGFYTHTSPITKAELDGEGKAYFLSDLRLYKLSIDNLSQGAEYLDTVCYNFTVQDDTVYYYNNTQTLLSSKGDKITLNYPLQSGSPLAFWKDLLYCVCKNSAENAYTLYAVNPETGKFDPITSFSEPLLSLAFTSNQLCAVTESNAFYAYSYSELNGKNAEEVTPILTKQDGYGYLYSYGDEVYATRNEVVCKYSAENTAFTDYEIGCNSSAPHRFRSASDILLFETELFIADAGNARISVYDTEKGTFKTPLSTAWENPKLAKYGETLLAFSNQEAVLYSLKEKHYGAELLRVTPKQGNIIGGVNVYGRYYLLTEDNYCYTLTEENGIWQSTETQKNTLSLRATAFTADVYGSLYVLYDNEKLYRFTEQELLTADASGIKLLEGINGVEKLAVDYATNVYALSNGILTRYTPNAQGVYEQTNAYAPDYGLVYDSNPKITSFAFGVKNEYAYLLYEGNYLIKTDELKIPIVNPIPTGNAKEIFFGQERSEFSVVTIPEGSILIEFNAEALENAKSFPYTAFARCQEEKTALKMGEESGYAILSAKHERSGEYRTYLARTTDCQVLPLTEYYTEYNEEKTGYLTNETELYKYPYLTKILALKTVPKTEKITILGEIMPLDYGYYHVKIGEETGYIPKAFLTLFDGSTPSANETTLGESEKDKDSVWRFAYLILGFGAICLLVDFLIFYKSKHRD